MITCLIVGFGLKGSGFNIQWWATYMPNSVFLTQKSQINNQDHKTKVVTLTNAKKSSTIIAKYAVYLNFWINFFSYRYITRYIRYRESVSRCSSDSFQHFCPGVGILALIHWVVDVTSWRFSHIIELPVWPAITTGLNNVLSS